VFDVFDKQTSRFLSTARVRELVNGRLTLVPTLYEAPFTTANDLATRIPSLIGRSVYSSVELAEGVYIRFERDMEVVSRAKYRRPSFTAGRSDFSSSIRRNNTLLEQAH